MTASSRRYFCTCLFYFLLIGLGNASRHIIPTPTFAGLRAAGAQYNLLPTPNSWTPSDIAKRLANDPGICGWVDGDILNPNSCQSDYTCASLATFIGCCLSNDSGCAALFTTCYDVRGKSCDAACFSNSAALVCTGTEPYCAVYRYTSGFRGYGCAAYTGYNKTVLATTSSSLVEPTPTPFDRSSTSTTVASSSTSGSGLVGITSVTAVPVTKNSMSGGAIAGTVVGSVLGIAAISLFLLFIFQKLRNNKYRRQGNQTSRGPYHLQDQPVYDQYGKPIYPPFWSPQGHSRQQSDGQSELEGIAVSPNLNKSPLASPGISEADGRPLSPETVQDSPSTNHGFSAGSGHQNRLAELPGAN